MKKLRRSTALTQKEFASKYNIPLKTLQNWEAHDDNNESRHCPSYVFDLLKRAVECDFPNSTQHIAEMAIENNSLKIDPVHKRVLKESIDKLESSSFADYISDVILYGSTARGMAKKSSDVDLLLVLNKKFKEIENYSKQILKMKGTISSSNYKDPETDLHVVFGNDWKKSKEAFFQNIRKDGISVWN